MPDQIGPTLLDAPTGTAMARPSAESSLRVLLIAEEANPDWASVPLEGWSHARAIARLARAHLVTQVRNRDAIARRGLTEGDDFTAIDSERFARPLRKLAESLRGGEGKGWTTLAALKGAMYAYFERLVWRQFGQAIRSGSFDIVHRLTPLSPTISSKLAGRCRRAGVPFVLGPLNGGLKWPRGYDAVRRREKEWLSYVRGLHRLSPRYGATRRNASAIIIGSRATWEQMPDRYRHKCVYIPENAIDPDRFQAMSDRDDDVVRIAFVGRLVPYKGADILLEAVAPLARAGRVHVDVIGDGPEMGRLKALVADKQLTGHVSLDGWVPHTELSERLSRAHVFGFPSIREFGGAVVLEAMALGLVPVVVDYGGPGELVEEQYGHAVPIGSRDQLIERFRGTIGDLVNEPARLRTMGDRARQRATTSFTWQAKAAQVYEVYRWVLGRRKDKPEFGMPLRYDHAS